MNFIMNVVEVSEKLLDIDEAFSRFEKPQDDYIATLSGNLKEGESEARYFLKNIATEKLILNQELNSWIHSVKVPVETHGDIEIPPEGVVSTAHLSIRRSSYKRP